MPELLRPGFGPTLPALLRERLGVAPRTTLIVAVAVALVVAGGIFAATRLAAEKQLVHEGDPVFNLLYDDDVVREVDPRRGELVRLASVLARQVDPGRIPERYQQALRPAPAAGGG